MSDTEKNTDGVKASSLQGVDNVAFTPISEDEVVVSFQPGQKPASEAQGQQAAEDGADYRYGCGRFKPRFLRKMANIKIFVFLAVLVCLVEGYAVNGVANAALVHLEKQFGLTSSRSALISSSQDIGALLTVLFVSFIGNRVCKPHWVAVGSAVMALGSFLFIVPHLATGASQKEKGPPPFGLCELADNSSTDSPDPGPSSSDSDLSHFLGVFMVANIVHGLGFTPMFTLGIAYIDENEDHATAAIYVGMTYAAAAVGVALGFFVGGQMTENYYVDFDSIDQSSLTFGPRDPQWVGAWWLGFVPACILFAILAVPLYGFPRVLPSGEPKEDADGDEKASTDSGDASGCGLVKEFVVTFFKAIKKLVVNIPFLCLSLGGAAETLIISGVSSFAFKYLAEQYNMSFDMAGNILGGLILVGATGMLSGGVLIRLFRLEAVGMTRMMAALTVVAALLGIAILADCSEVRLAGQEVPYPGDTSVKDFSAACQGSCQCGDMSFNPVCGSDSRVYYSPCHAGCLNMSNPGPMATYHNCSCVAMAQNVSLWSDDASASRGRCSVSCDNKYIFLPCLFVMFLAVLLTTTPNSMSTLRVVDPDLRPFALGFQWMLIRLLGTIPGPPVVGFVLDKTCLLWNRSPDGIESCALYNKDDMSKGIFIWWVVVNLVAMVFYFVASCLLGWRKKSVNLKD